MNKITLGNVGEYPIDLYYQQKSDKLVIAGFHGDQRCPTSSIWFTILSQKCPQNLAFIPIVSHNAAFKMQHLSNGLNCNRGYCFEDEFKDVLSAQGIILKNNIDTILKFSKNGVLTLHQDADSDMAYMYSYCKDINISNKLLYILKQNYKIQPDGTQLGLGNIQNGIVHNQHDGSFEEYMHTMGIEKVFCTQTPGKLDQLKRVYVNMEIIKTFSEI